MAKIDTNIEPLSSIGTTPEADVTAVHHVFTVLKGFFLQDDLDTDPEGFDYNDPDLNFGLINRAYDTDTSFDVSRQKTQWQRFERYVSDLNFESPKNTQYKILFMGRHGEGYHNVAERYYGTAEWDRYWSKLEGNGTVTWADAHLTDIGIEQAKTANAFWKRGIREWGIPVPEKYYTSPLDRCLATAQYTFEGLELPADRPFVPEVKELLREVIGVHTCDRRSSRTYIESHYPAYKIEDGLTEDDELYSPTHREITEEQVTRLRELLNDVFTHDKNTWISFTSHSGAIAALLEALGHRKFRLPTGGVIPVLVKAVA
ncbi:hypothetical protein LTR04_006166 [Oleoguttula sp. CCFEE 6159]|nr:hypothetical protein LTR04_006166 [Oleoguttula sp. CCFEE 6159]